MVNITFRLVGGRMDRYFRRIEVDPEIHTAELIKRIEHVTQVPGDFQQIMFRGQRLQKNEYPLQSIRFGEEIVISHILLLNWNVYTTMIEEIKRMTTSGVTSERRDLALKARVQLSPLFASKFFVSYPDLALEELEISKNLNFLVHNVKKYLDRSVLAHFSALFPGRIIELRAKSHDSAGIHLGVFVLIDGVAEYYAKTLGSIPGPDEEIDFPNRPTVDLMEIFVYILLKLMGFGPKEVHVIPDVKNSELVFIATQLLRGFRTASGISADQMLTPLKVTEGCSTEANTSVVIDLEMRKEMKILSSFLCLSDLIRNIGNHGVVEIESSEHKVEEGNSTRRQLKIIDFKVNVGLIDTEPSICDPKANVPDLKNYLQKWDMLKNVRNAKIELENTAALRNNTKVNKKTFERYYKRLESCLENILEK